MSSPETVHLPNAWCDGGPSCPGWVGDCDAELRAIFGEPVEGRDYEQVDGTEIGTWTEQYDGTPTQAEDSREMG